MSKLILIIFGWLSLGMPVQAASFDCAKAASKVEHLICGDAELSKLDKKLVKALGDAYTASLSKLDDELGKLYQRTLGKANEEQRQQLIFEQKHWLKYTRNLCQDITCLKLAYWSRQAALATFFEPKSPQYVHEADKAEAIKQVLATTQLELIRGATNVPNFCPRMLDDLKQMKDIRFVDPVVQTQSYEDPALDKWKQYCGAKPPLHFSRGCLPNIAANLPESKEGFAESLAECDVGFGLPPFKVYELAPIESTDKSRVIFYSDDAYGPMNLDWRKPLLGGGFAGFYQIDPSKCEQVERTAPSGGAAIGASIDADERNRKNYNSIIEYKKQYYFFVLRSYLSSRWWLDIETITPFRAKNQKSCTWSPVISESTSNQGSK